MGRRDASACPARAHIPQRVEHTQLIKRHNERRTKNPKEIREHTHNTNTVQGYTGRNTWSGGEGMKMQVASPCLEMQKLPKKKVRDHKDASPDRRHARQAPFLRANCLLL
jgi:hypothetical protein